MKPAPLPITIRMNEMRKHIKNLFKYFIKVTSLMEAQRLSGKLIFTSIPKSCNRQEIDCDLPAVLRD